MQSIVEPVAILLVVETANGATIPFRWPANPQDELRQRKRERRVSAGSPDDSRSVPHSSPRNCDAHSWDSSDEAGSSEEEENDSYIRTVIDLQAPPTSLRSSSKDTIQPRTSSRSSSLRPSASRQSRPNALAGLVSASISPSSTFTALPGPPSSQHTGLPPSSDDPEWNPDEYIRYLGFGALNLAKMLTPARELCQQRFELVCDDYCFLGHPMRAPGPNRKWDVEEEGGRRERGRPKGPRVTTNGEGASTATALEDVQELASPQKPSSALGLIRGPAAAQSVVSSSTKSSDEDISLFHLVIVTERTEDALVDGAMTDTERLEALYKEVIFKVTAALYEAQTTDEWISKQARELTHKRDSAKDARLWTALPF